MKKFRIKKFLSDVWTKYLIASNNVHSNLAWNIYHATSYILSNNNVEVIEVDDYNQFVFRGFIFYTADGEKVIKECKESVFRMYIPFILTKIYGDILKQYTRVEVYTTYEKKLNEVMLYALPYYFDSYNFWYNSQYKSISSGIVYRHKNGINDQHQLLFLNLILTPKFIVDCYLNNEMTKEYFSLIRFMNDDNCLTIINNEKIFNKVPISVFHKDISINEFETEMRYYTDDNFRLSCYYDYKCGNNIMFT